MPDDAKLAMNPVPQVGLPLLLVVTGRPGSGKTTLASLLGRAIRCPVISRDEFKEGLVNTNGDASAPTDDIALKIYELFFETIKLLLTDRITLIAEAAFQHSRWSPRLEPLRQIARIRIVVCDINAKLAHTRFLERGIADPARERFHPDPVMQGVGDGGDVPVAEYDPPHLDLPTLTVNTSDGYQPAIEEIVSFVRG
jgi:predicted kinase